jgi:hypothetical protein
VEHGNFLGAARLVGIACFISKGYLLELEDFEMTHQT